MRAVITVLGKDTVGILAAVSAKCAESNINIIEVTQSVLSDMFAMTMMVDITKSSVDFVAFSEELSAMGKLKGLAIHTMHEDIFDAMHNI